MRHCPKCNLTYSDDSKICRSCGSILGLMSDVTPATSGADKPADQRLPAAIEKSALEIPPRDSVSADAWICTKCGESVPASFDVCWNCEADLGLANHEPAPVDPPEACEPPPPPLTTPTLRCAVCGSDRVIPNVHVADQGQHSSGQLSVVIDANPDALIFKERLQIGVVADICGACGHVQLRAEDPQALYEHHQRSKSGS